MNAIVLIDHGSRRAEANAQLEALAREVRARRPDAHVATAHLEVVPPDLAHAVAACVAAGATRVVVHPFFLSPGRHTQEDLPRLVDAARAEHPGVAIALSEPLGLDARIVDVALARIDAARTDAPERA
ncbi:MAG: CbiX/SirB N-terminal domain-containing protein [Myxococcota bacterium]